MPPRTPDQIVSAYTAQLIPVSDAAKLFGMSKSTFLRLRKKHGVKSLPGQRVHVADIIRAMEQERVPKDQASGKSKSR